MYTYNNVHCGSQFEFEHPQKIVKINDKCSFPCDEKISDCVELLNKKGYKTKYSCQGDDNNYLYILFDSLDNECESALTKIEKSKYFIIEKNEFSENENLWIIKIKSMNIQKNLGDKRFKILNSLITSLPIIK